MSSKYSNTVHIFDTNTAHYKFKYFNVCMFAIFAIFAFLVYQNIDFSNFSTKSHFVYANTLEYFDKSIDSAKKIANIVTSDEINLSIPNPIGSNAIQNKIPSNLTSDKSGDEYCYYGEENGVRYCAKVQSGTKCMSDGVFKTKDVCMNPNLRY